VDVRCSGTCCERSKKLAEMSPDKGLILVSRQHGTLHTAQVSAKEIVHILVGTLEASAIFSWVKSLSGSNV
jgi:hypothetical protein